MKNKESSQPDQAFPFRTAEVAEAIDVVPSRILQQVREIESAGHAKKMGRDWWFSQGAVDFLKKRSREPQILRGTTPEGGKITIKRMSGGKVQSGAG